MRKKKRKFIADSLNNNISQTKIMDASTAGPQHHQDQPIVLQNNQSSKANKRVQHQIEEQQQRLKPQGNNTAITKG